MVQYKSPKPAGVTELPVVELFETVQGEGIYTGVPSVFFRTGMCNLACPGCDTVWHEWENQSNTAVIAKIQTFKAKHLVLTGGEPTLWQGHLALLLHFLGYEYTVTVESNGAVPITNGSLLNRVNLWSFSPKVGSLGPDEKFSRDAVIANITRTAGKNQIKYVLDPHTPAHVESVFDFHKTVEEFIHDERVFFQPYDTETLVNIKHAPGLDDRDTYLKRFAALTDLVMQRSGSRFRVQPQMHKLLSYR